MACTLLPGCPSLSGLNHLLAHVLAPWLAAQQPDGSSTSSEPTFTAATELLATTHKLAAQAAACAKHLRSEVALALPTLPPGVDLADPASAAGSEEAVLACERCMEEWVGLCTGVLQRESAACPANRGPLAELDLWQNRAEAYGGLLEQLSVPAVRRVQEVVERGSMDANLAASFRAQLTEMARLSLEARDNARFLLTLERHFRALESGHLAAVADALQPMLNALRMVRWRSGVGAEAWEAGMGGRQGWGAGRALRSGCMHARLTLLNLKACQAAPLSQRYVLSSNLTPADLVCVAPLWR